MHAHEAYSNLLRAFCVPDFLTAGVVAPARRAGYPSHRRKRQPNYSDVFRLKTMSGVVSVNHSKELLDSGRSRS